MSLRSVPITKALCSLHRRSLSSNSPGEHTGIHRIARSLGFGEPALNRGAIRSVRHRPAQRQPLRHFPAHVGRCFLRVTRIVAQEDDDVCPALVEALEAALEQLPRPV
jgi:hypothetical protein